MNDERRKILIIDDEAVLRDTFQEILDSCGYICSTAESSPDGIRKLKTGQFDLVLLDIMMEPLDGLDTLDFIQNLPNGQDIPVILCSAKRLFSDELIRYGDQLFGFFKKPLNRDVLCREVASFFSWYHNLLLSAQKAGEEGVPALDCHRWIGLNRQIRVINDLKEKVSPRCIPAESRTEEECMREYMATINEIIEDKTEELGTLNRRYTQFQGKAPLPGKL